MPRSTTPNVGDKAPDFQLNDHTGKPVTLSELLKHNGGTAVVLYFYPKDNTPGCTAQGCAFRDAYEDFTDAGATVVGVSSDSEESHRNFAQRKNFPFTLLADPGGKVRSLYNAKDLMGLLPGRVTFVIDPDGIVRCRFSSQINMAKHVRTAIETVRNIAAQRGGSTNQSTT